MKDNEKLLDRHDEMLISRFLSTVGILPSRMGYTLIKDAVALFMYGVRKMSDIQAQLSETYKISCSAVERDIRSAIESACNSDSLCNINNILGINIIAPGEQMTAKYLISLISEYLYDPIVRKNLLKG